MQKDYGIEGIPEMILFVPNGTIVECEGDLRGAGLNYALDKYLKKEDRIQIYTTVRKCQGNPRGYS